MKNSADTDREEGGPEGKRVKATETSGRSDIFRNGEQCLRYRFQCWEYRSSAL